MLGKRQRRVATRAQESAEAPELGTPTKMFEELVKAAVNDTPELPSRRVTYAEQ